MEKTRVAPWKKAAFVTTVYNAAESIGGAILSGLNQTYPLEEYVVIDDGSSDASWGVVRELAARHPNLIARRAGRIGRAAALNTAVGMCSSDIIFIQDADDYSEPNRVAAAMALFDSEPALGVVAGSYRAVDLQRGICAVRQPHREHEGILRAMCAGVPICHTASAYRKEAWRAVGGYPNITPEIVDLPFWIAVARTGWLFCGQEHVVATHHYYPSSSFSRMFRRRRRAWILYRYNLFAFQTLRSSWPNLAWGTARLVSALLLPERLRGALRMAALRQQYAGVFRERSGSMDP